MINAIASEVEAVHLLVLSDVHSQATAATGKVHNSTVPSSAQAREWLTVNSIASEQWHRYIAVASSFSQRNKLLLRQPLGTHHPAGPLVLESAQGSIELLVAKGLAVLVTSRLVAGIGNQSPLQVLTLSFLLPAVLPNSCQTAAISSQASMQLGSRSTA